jgi:hypothetical protein
MGLNCKTLGSMNKASCWLQSFMYKTVIYKAKFQWNQERKEH